MMNSPFEQEMLKMQKKIHALAVEKGWYAGDDPPNIPEKLALIHSEVSEALEVLRIPAGNISSGKRKELFGEELADIVTRIFDLCGHSEINLGFHIEKKYEKNQTRPYRHGGKIF